MKRSPCPLSPPCQLLLLCRFICKDQTRTLPDFSILSLRSDVPRWFDGLRCTGGSIKWKQTEFSLFSLPSSLLAPFLLSSFLLISSVCLSVCLVGEVLEIKPMSSCVLRMDSTNLHPQPRIQILDHSRFFAISGFKSSLCPNLPCSGPIIRSHELQGPCVTLQSQDILETGRQNENVNLDSSLWPRHVLYVQEYFLPFLDFL